MSSPLTDQDIDQQVLPKIYTQDYSPKLSIDGVKIIPVKNFVGEEGDFSEILRINPSGEVEGISGFKIAQINRTKLLSGSLKAWHMHMRQDEVWYVTPSDRLFVGLWDLRNASSTKGKAMRIVLGGGSSHMLFIPRGVAHGYANTLERAVEMYYFTSEMFDINNPDEKRLPWDSLGGDFWLPERD